MFAAPTASASGWERGIDAQARMVDGLGDLVPDGSVQAFAVTPDGSTVVEPQAAGEWSRFDSLFDLVGALFLSAWLLGWSIAPLLMTAVLLLMLFGREVLRSADRRVLQGELAGPLAARQAEVAQLQRDGDNERDHHGDDLERIKLIGRVFALVFRLDDQNAEAYDARGQVIWTLRQMALIPEAPTLTITDDNPGPGLPPTIPISPP